MFIRLTKAEVRQACGEAGDAQRSCKKGDYVQKVKGGQKKEA
jgi:hypothetical protein